MIHDPRELVALLHAGPTRLVFEFAGAGASALALLHAVGGSSRTVLEATDRYAAGSLAEALGWSPAQAVSADVAAAAGHQRDFPFKAKLHFQSPCRRSSVAVAGRRACDP